MTAGEADLLVPAFADAWFEADGRRDLFDRLCQKLFGKKSERVSPDQLRLAFAQLAEELKPRDEPTEMDTGERPGKQHRRPTRPTWTGRCRPPARRRRTPR